MKKVDVRSMSLRSLEQRLAGFEQAYGVPSHSLTQAFVVGGRLQETDDFRLWSRLYRTYVSAVATLERRTA